MKYLLTLAMAALLAGCAATPPSTLHVSVPVPVACTAPEMPSKPRLSLEDLPDTATDAETIEAYANSLRACGNYSKKLEILLKVPAK